MSGRTALVLGATGGIGGAVARRLKAQGWAVRALHRAPERVAQTGGFTWVKGDALVAGDVAAAAEGADLIVHAVNPPGYRNWRETVLPMLDNTLAAARPRQARVLLPGTVYNYGPDALPLPVEDSPQNPVTVKGKIRAGMEQRLADAAARGDARVLIVRAGDYFGPGAANSWFSQGLVKPGRRPKSLTAIGKPGVGHQWAYLPDVADTMIALLARDDLPAFARFHMAGHWDADGTEMLAAIRAVLGAPALKAARLPWGLMRLASPVVPLFRELLEMKYLWDMPVRLRNDRLVGVLGAEPHTPLGVAVRAALADLGCLGAPGA